VGFSSPMHAVRPSLGADTGHLPLPSQYSSVAASEQIAQELPRILNGITGRARDV